MGMTEIQKWAREQLDENEKTTLRNVQKLEKMGYLGKKKFRRCGKHERYFVNTDKDHTSHGFYVKSLKSNEFAINQTQSQLSNLIQRNMKSFDEELKKFNKEKDDLWFLGTYQILWANNFYAKLSWCLNCFWFGHSKKEQFLAEQNKRTLEKHMKNVMSTIQKINFNIWHDIIHSIYDIIDSHRILEPEDWQRLYGIKQYVDKSRKPAVRKRKK